MPLGQWLSCLKTVDHIGVCTQRCCFVTKACPTLHEPRGLELARARSLTISWSLPLFGDMLKYSVPFSASQISASFNMGIWIRYSHWLNCTNNHKAEYVCWVNKTFQNKSPENWSQSIFKYCLSPSSQVSVCFFKKCPTSCSLHLWSEFTTGKRDEIVKYEIWHLWGCILAPSTYSGTHNMKDVNRFSSMIYWRQLDSSIDVTQFTCTLLKKLLSKNTPPCLSFCLFTSRKNVLFRHLFGAWFCFPIFFRF